MSTMIENHWDPRLQNQNGPITSGFVSNSDIRQRERADQIKWERQREYEDMMNKNIKVNYMDTHGLSLPVGGYEESRKVYDDQRQKECIEFMAQKREAENKRKEELYLNSQRNYKPPPEPEMYDHHQISKDLREERQKEYNDYLREKDNQILSSRRPPPTPPGGLNIATEQERKKLENLKKSMYREELLKQKNQQLFHRAQQEGILPVLNSGSPIPTNRMSPRSPPRGRPPPHPNSRVPPHDDRTAQGSMDKSRQTPNYWNNGRQAPSPKSVDSETKYVETGNKPESRSENRTKQLQPQDKQKPIDEVRTGFFDDRRQSPLNRDERQHEYQEYLAKKQHDDDMRRQKLDEQRHAPRPDISKGDYYDADAYERKKQNLNSQRREEYQDYLSKKTPDHGRREWHDSSNPKGIIAGIDSYNYDKRKTFAEERKKEYREVMEKKYGNQPVRRAPDQPNPNSIGFVANMGRHEQERSRLGKQRQDEYKKFLDERSKVEYDNMMKKIQSSTEDSWYRQEPPPFHHSPGPDRAPEQRPDSYGRRQTPSYQDILDSKRREEASYRRFDDPEYSRGGAPPGGPYDRYD